MYSTQHPRTKLALNRRLGLFIYDNTTARGETVDLVRKRVWSCMKNRILRNETAEKKNISISTILKRENNVKIKKVTRFKEDVKHSVQLGLTYARKVAIFYK